ncbi:5'-nucleotidase, lipoprotein e(P4) family [Mucilaginibacter boryungensis]|uniref:5'-nucleotidase, lipoprotein e(P4) family n=1 Tax=Mucilaginibacter boryungensis TaxID=768480 RepID=A0ABR9XJ52_9SPHI|nr:5'-nucleotidase, lipoprotein e(P4) family [Mucilaginibacter boryungensis]MBE9667256.1 5'-nucleotidase, lipoprotein e(P4) family [Mucilaginibacter boryungensis]
MKIKFAICTALICVAINSSGQSQKLSTANGGKTWSSLWQQRSAEYKALCFQAYNIACLRVAEAVKHKHTKPLAVITDIDETLLDNSPEDARAAINNQEFDTKDWKKWTSQGIADTVPGAPAFFKYAASKGVTVFYITNRDEDERAGTLKNLQLYHLPNADNAHLLLKTNTSSKETRRQQVLKKYTIVLLCGDNLADFNALYDNHPSEQMREENTKKLIKDFGSKYIVLPNPSYGDWEGSLYKFDYKLTQAQKDSVIRSTIKTAH